MKGKQHVQVHVNVTRKKRRYSEAQTWLEGLQATAKKCLNVLQRGLRGGVGAEVLTKRSAPTPRARTRDHPQPLWLGRNLGDAVQGPDRVIRGSPTARHGLRHHLAEVSTLTTRAATPAVGRRRCAKVCRDREGPANEENSSQVTALRTSKWLPTMSARSEADKNARDQGLVGGKKATGPRETNFGLDEGIESEGTP